MLLSHPNVAEAVAFGTPDEKYGEIVAAAVVLSKPAQDTAAFAQDLRKHAGSKMSSFKVGALWCSMACRAGLSEAGRQRMSTSSGWQALPCSQPAVWWEGSPCTTVSGCMHLAEGQAFLSAHLGRLCSMQETAVHRGVLAACIGGQLTRTWLQEPVLPERQQQWLVQHARLGCARLACVTAGCCTRGQLLETLCVSCMLGAEQEALSMQAALSCIKVIFEDGILSGTMQQG